MTETPALCPVCQTRTLFDHCPSPTCTWNKCRNKPCDAVLDIGKGRGHARHPDPTSPDRRDITLGGAA